MDRKPVVQSALHLAVDPSSRTTLQRQVFEQIVAAIGAGTLTHGDLLPSTRELSRQLSVSRNTVAECYERLAAEGYITTTRAKGTYVSRAAADGSVRSGDATMRGAGSAPVPTNLPRPYGARGLPGLYEPPDPSIRVDFRFGRSDPQSFPQKVWRRLLLECLGGAPECMSQYNDPAGLPALRQLIAGYLHASRAMDVDAEQVIIVGGFQQGLNLVAHLFVGINTAVVMEAPCYRGAAFLFESYGGRIVAVPVDENGIDIAQLPATGAKLVYVTPSHQFPTGVTMPVPRRIALLDWAAKAGAYVLEVDYDADFRYEGSLHPSLQSLDRNACVIYLNSFSRSLGPGLRLGYIVVPRALVHAATTLKGLIDNGCPWLEQAALAEFLRCGSFAAHLNRMRKIYGRRRDAVVTSIARYFGDEDLSGCEGGTHILWKRAESDLAASELQRAARAAGVGIHPIASGAVLHHDVIPGSRNWIVLGYTHLNEASIDEGLSRVARVAGGPHGRPRRFVS